jgi:ATP-dependent DNA helicase RecG
VLSPGGPYGIVNAQNFGQPGLTDYRNPTIAGVMKTFGFVQRFGIGIAEARRALAANGNPPLEFQVEPNFVLFVLRRAE